ncbi:MAG: SDR family oxidoreductase [Sandaracinaceae bacterium]
MSRVAVVVGVGPGLGTALARRFHEEGYAVALLARRGVSIEALAAELPGSLAVPCDVTDDESVARAITRITERLGPPDVVVYNAGKGIWGRPLEVGIEDLETCLAVNAVGLLRVGRSVLPVMRDRGGVLLVIGATASRRGAAGATVFAAAKAAQRSIAQSMARAYGSDGVHVCLLVVDAVIDEPVARGMFADRADDRFARPEEIAETAVGLTRQPRSAWTFELEVRPFNEPW